MSQSLANIIIYGGEDDVARFLKTENPLDEVDEYGYTPLIQTAIVNSLEKARLILDAGADVNFTDLTGRTALHWACDNNNYEFAKLLIERGANTNAYMRAGQPVLVTPFLRGYDKIKQLLYDNHADLNFCQDFVNSKLIGHRFELEARIDIVDNTGKFFEIEFEGFYLEFSLEIIANSLKDFKNNFGGKHLREFFDKLDIIIDGLLGARELMRFQHYLVKVKDNDQAIDRLLGAPILVLPVSFGGHAITFIRAGSWLIRCDRGEYGRENGTVIIYKMENAARLSKSFIKNLIYKRQDASFINSSLGEILGLVPRMSLPISDQSAGNCTWANVEAVVPSMMFLLLLDEQRKTSGSSIDLNHCQEEAMRFYRDWAEWDKARALHFCIGSFYSANPARKASKAAILAAVLFQTCRYNEPEHMERAERILQILTTPEYHYILQAYIDVFSKPRHPFLDNLKLFLDDIGFDITRLREQASGE